MRHAVNKYLFPAYILSLLIPNLVMEGQLKYLPSILIMIVGLICLIKDFSTLLKRFDFKLFASLFTLILCYTIFKYPYMESVKVFLLLLHCIFVYLLCSLEDSEIIKRIKLTTLVLSPICFIPIFSKDNYLQSIFLYRNDFAGFIGVLFFFIDFSWENKKTKNWLLLMIFIVSLLTKSRSTLVFFSVYMFFRFGFGYFNWQLKYKKIIVLAFLLILNGIYFSILENPQVVTKLNNLVSFNLHKDKNLFQLSGRENLYEETTNILRHNPFGIGSQEAKIRYDQHNQAATPHNIYLKFLAEYGWAFTFILIVALLVFLFSIENQIYLIFYAGLLTKGMFESFLPFGFSFFTAFLIAPYLAKIKSNQPKN
jgi:hypothetical protein